MTSDGGTKETVNWRLTWYGRVIMVAIWVVLVLAAILVEWLVIDGRGTQGLWHVVNDMCRPIQKHTGHPFPCLEVSPDGGWAIVHAPFDGSQFLVVPLARITGIEDPASRRPRATDLWSVAWDHRRLVGERAGRALRNDEIALAVNSQSSRTQSHYHIHVDCLDAAVRRRLAEELPGIGTDWRELRPVASVAPYRVRRIDAATLRQEPLDRLIERELKPSAAAYEDLSIALIGTTEGTAENPVFVVGVTFGQADDEGGHAEELIDHKCRAS